MVKDKQQALGAFRKLMPLTNLHQEQDEIRYRFKRKESARYFEARALEMILKEGLPLITAVEEWSRKGVVFEVNLVIAMAPEETIVS